jgi:tetratricopeptide (TPR) repeat protein
MGEAYEQLESYEDAFRNYQRSSQLAPDLVDSWLGMGVVCDLMGETVKGLNFIQKALDLDPDNASLWHAFANCAERNGTHELALEAYRQALLLEPKNDDIIADYAKLLGEESVQEAINFLEINFEKNDFTGKSALLLIRFSFMSGFQAKALSLYKDLTFYAPETAKELFLHFPEAQSVQSFIELYELIK